MTGSEYLWVIAGAALVTYLTRWPPLLVGRLIRVTPRLKNGLNYIPIGVFAAMVVPAIVLHPANHGWDIPILGAALISLCVAYFTKSPLWTMLAGVLSAAVLRML